MEVGISVKDAAGRLGISVPMMWRLVTGGQVATFRIGARRLVPVTEIQRIVDSAKFEPAR